MDEFKRTELLIGSEAIKKLSGSRVAVFGIGGVGGYVVEALVRSGIGQIDLIDHDIVSSSNINRQIIALNSTVGRLKVEVAAERAKDINPTVRVNAVNAFFMPDNADQFDFTQYDYIVDAIDTVTGKLAIIEKAKSVDIPVISAMGAGNKLKAETFKIGDISETSVCPLARVMRRELKKRGIFHLKTVFSTEPALKPMHNIQNEEQTISEKKQTPGSIAYAPAVMGLLLAEEVINDLIN